MTEQDIKDWFSAYLPELPPLITDGGLNVWNIKIRNSIVVRVSSGDKTQNLRDMLVGSMFGLIGELTVLAANLQRQERKEQDGKTDSPNTSNH